MNKVSSYWPTWRIDLGAVGACLCLGFIGYLLVLAPVLDRRAKAARLAEDCVASCEEADSLEARLGSLRVEFERKRKKLAENDLKLLPAGQVNQRIAELTTLLSTCGLDVDDIKPGEPTRTQRCEIIPINLAGTGGYASCSRLLHALAGRFPDMAVAAFRVDSLRVPTRGHGRFTVSLRWHALGDT